jgi:pyruvate, water dikinase
MIPPSDRTIDNILHDLQERAKELNCLYRVEDLLGRQDASFDDVLRGVMQVVPPAFQFPDVCVCRIALGSRVYEPEGFRTSPFVLASPIMVQGELAGRLEVYYLEAMPPFDEGPFLKEERKLLDTIAERVGHLVARRNLERALAPRGEAAGVVHEWSFVLDFLRQTDRALLGRLGRRMLHHLWWNGIEEASRLLHGPSSEREPGDAESAKENRPQPRAALAAETDVADVAFRIAGEHLTDDEIVSCVQGWIKEDKSKFLKDALARLDTPLRELADALQRFRHAGVEERDLSRATQVGFRAALVRRFLTDSPEFLRIAKEYVEVADFHDLAQRIVYPAKSYGRIGGKAAGLFLAGRILARSKEYAHILGDIRIPRSWYIPSDGLQDFIHHNDLEDVHDRKYMDADRIQEEYPHIVQVFKHSAFPPEILRGLAVALDDLEGRPVIVRSSSLLEDRLGAAFSGKYKSLFLPNNGSKRERMEALTDAIAEVYASLFGPDPIEYRARRGLLDEHEEMGILIQEVVGVRVGAYHLPVFSGVGFSNNEFRWSPRIRREDGLLRIVPGLGTRAVDRLADDYPVLVAPGQPGLRVNQTVEEFLRYSPKRMDVIDVERGVFESVAVTDFVRAHGDELPLARQTFSVVERDLLRKPAGFLDCDADAVVVTFEGLLADTPFLARMRTLLQVLRERMKTAIDIEFASDGERLYLLQCRAQGTSSASRVTIPRNLPRERVLFTANRYVSNGEVHDIGHVVYVDPVAYGQLQPRQMKEVSRAVGRLNRLLPKRRFILMGPGRWGSRGDVRLGVPVGYADISNSAVLVEMAREAGGRVPDLSFGTHFFQDLVESSIPYLPLYPDDPGVVFNHSFFVESPSVLGELAPEFSWSAPALRVIDVPRTTGGLVLRVLMDGEQDEAVGALFSPTQGAGDPTPRRGPAS